MLSPDERTPAAWRKVVHITYSRWCRGIAERSIILPDVVVAMAEEFLLAEMGGVNRFCPMGEGGKGG